MAWRCSGRSNAELIGNLTAASLIRSGRVRAAMAAVDRGHFCGGGGASSAYEDSPQSIGYGATISAPHMHAAAAEALEPYLGATTTDEGEVEGEGEGEGRRVLDIGSGSGYLTAVLAEMVGERGRVVGVEHVEQLARMGRENVAKSAAGRA